MAPYATLGHFACPTGEMAKPCQGISPVGQAKCLDRTERTDLTGLVSYRLGLV